MTHSKGGILMGIRLAEVVGVLMLRAGSKYPVETVADIHSRLSEIYAKGEVEEFAAEDIADMLVQINLQRRCIVALPLPRLVI
jgi:hypothetical protein